MQRNGHRRQRRGQALAEMAVMVPFLVLGMMGFLDLGRAFYYQISLANAVREAVRYGVQNAYYGLNASCATPPTPLGANCPVPTDANIISRVNQELTGTGFSVQPSNVAVSPDQNGRVANWLGLGGATKTQYQITVSASYQFTFITPLIGSLFGGSIMLQTSAEMRTDY